jgi:2'-5' RNA ligase
MHSVELVLDDETDARIRDYWVALAEAGLPSRAGHTGASNRPHVTLALTQTIDDDVLIRLDAAVAALPLTVTVGGLLLFGTRRLVLSRLVISTQELLELQLRVRAAIDDEQDPHRTFDVGRWTPHITLARRLTADQLAPALQALGEQPMITGEVVRARRWDMVAKQERWLNAGSTGSVAPA